MGRYLELEPESSLGWDRDSQRQPAVEVVPEEREKPPTGWLKPAVLAILAASTTMVLVMKWGTSQTMTPAGIPTVAFEAKRTEILVYVAGEVQKPGVVKLDGGARVNDAIKAAGGFTERANQVAVNLAAKVHDEEMIRVRAIGEAPEPEPVTTPGPEASGMPAADPNAPEFPKAPPPRPVDVTSQMTPAPEPSGHFEGGVVEAIENKRPEPTRPPRSQVPEPVSAPVPHPPAPQLTPAAMVSPAPAETPASRPVAAPEEPPATRVSINRATADQLEKIPGLTPRQAADIVAYRRGPPPRAFTSLDELEKVPSLRQAKMNEVMLHLKL